MKIFFFHTGIILRMKNWHIKELSEDIHDALENAHKTQVGENDPFYSFVKNNLERFLTIWLHFKKHKK
jgi:hypothetical protein